MPSGGGSPGRQAGALRVLLAAAALVLLLAGPAYAQTDPTTTVPTATTVPVDTTTIAPSTTAPPTTAPPTTAPPTTAPPTTAPPPTAAAAAVVSVVLDGDQAGAFYAVAGLVALAVGLYLYQSLWGGKAER